MKLPDHTHGMLRRYLRQFIPYYMELLGDGLIIAGMGFWVFIMLAEQMYGSITMVEYNPVVRGIEIGLFSCGVILGFDRLIDDLIKRHWKD